MKSDDTSENEYQNFSDDVLKIEISGPDRSHFSILDVPGVFQSLTKNLTEKDKTGVNSMVSGYMASLQSVIMYDSFRARLLTSLTKVVVSQVEQTTSPTSPSSTKPLYGT